VGGASRSAIFDNLVVARVASLLNVPSIAVRKRRDRMGMFGQDSFLSLDLFESSVTRPGEAVAGHLDLVAVGQASPDLHRTDVRQSLTYVRH
jgi:hypothetical protein